MRKRHLLILDYGMEAAACKARGALWVTQSYNDTTCRRCQSTKDWQQAYEEAINPRDDAYERAAAKYDGEGKDWR